LDNKIRQKRFTKALVAFHKDLFSFPWEERFPKCIFVRDYELLPDKAPYDVDIMLQVTYWNDFQETITNMASQRGLKIFFTRTKNHLLFIILDICNDKNFRTWVYYEIHQSLKISKEIVFKIDEIEINRKNPLPIPISKWNFIILLLQGIRKNKLHLYLEDLKKLFSDGRDEIADLCKSTIGLTADDINSILYVDQNLQKWQKKLKITVPQKIEKNPTLKLKISKYIFKYLYFIHIHDVVFFTIHGADGVGKSTVVKEIDKIFSGFPLPFTYFHHISGWKKKWREELSAGNHNNHMNTGIISDKEKKHSPYFFIVFQLIFKNFIRILKIFWRYTPQYLKNIWILQDSEILYASKINNLISEHYFSRKIILSDRYVYDSWIKKMLSSRISNVHNFLYLLNCKVLRPPRLAIIIRDKPELINKRKPDLTVDQVEKFQKIIVDICKKLKLRTTIIDVDGRDPQSIASEIADLILTYVGGDLCLLAGKEYIK